MGDQPKMKTAVITTRYGDAKEYTPITFPRIRRWAKKMGSDFFINEVGTCHVTMWRGVLELSKGYDKVFVLDGDILIPHDAGNIFDAWPPMVDFWARRQDNYSAWAKTKYIRNVLCHRNFKYEDYFQWNIVGLNNYVLEKMREVFDTEERGEGSVKTDQEYWNPRIKAMGVVRQHLPIFWNLNISESDPWHQWVRDMAFNVFHVKGGGKEGGIPYKVRMLKKMAEQLRKAKR